MVRLALPSGWAGALARQRGPLRTYQWLWLLLCTAGALLVAAPRVLLQPVIFQAQAETRFDMARYGGLYRDGSSGPDFVIARDDATEALRQRFLAQRELRFGLPDFRVEYIPAEPGVVQVRGVAPSAAEARMLADQGAEELVRQIRAAGGREVLRNLLGWELVVALRGEGPASRFQEDLRAIIARDAFPLSRRIEPVSQRIDVANLPPEEQNDLTRALEARYDLWTFEINTRNTAIDTACGTAGVTAERERQARLGECAARNVSVGQELAARDQALDRREAIAAALDYMRTQQRAVFAPDAPGSVRRVAAVLPDAPLPRYILPLLALAALVGLMFGGAGVAVDRSAGVMPKLNELWSYRELIRNLVLRDLRVRYKGSALGYLWTQIAPLLMMLVFWFVFSFIQPNGVAMFPIFLIVGLLPWNMCSEAIMGGARSVIDNANLIKKVFFPREVLPLVSVLSSLLNYLLSLPVMFLVMAIVQLLYQPLRDQDRLFNFSWTIAYLPVLIAIEALLLAGLALFMSALAVRFRDFVHLIGILIQFWFFLTPVVYSLGGIDRMVGGVPLAQLIRWANPMASLIEFYREILYGNTVGMNQIPTPGLPALTGVLRVLVTALVILALGYWFFQRRSGQFGEEI
jgi:lipopolysaccharide transport system permease protein